jgi:hypothetical protein
MATKRELDKQAKEIIKIAEENGVQSNYFFVTTFERYQTQLKVLERLKKEIESKETEPTVKKEYVKNRGNVYVNPLYPEYNRAVDSANKTVATLMRIIKNFNVEEKTDEDEDPLFKAINGGGDNE